MIYLRSGQASEDEEKRVSAEVARRMNPQTVGDFELLYSELDTWLQKESKLASELSPHEKKIRNAEILAKQTKALQTISRLKTVAAADHRGKKIDKVLKLMAKPKLWEMSNGEAQEVHTQFTVRASELRDLYIGLSNSSPLDERLDVLLNVKVGFKPAPQN